MPMGDRGHGVALRRGQIYWIEWEPGRGSEQRRRRPGLIIQADPINASRAYRNTIVVALTTSDHGVPTHVAIEPDSANGLERTLFAMCEQVMAVARDRLGQYIGSADDATMARISRALKRALSLT